MSEKHNTSNQVTTPGGLKLGTRFVKPDGTTCIDYKAGKRHDIMTVAQMVGAVMGYPVKDIIIVPDDISPVK